MLGVRVWKVHLELSRLLVRMGLLPRAEAILFEATSLGAQHSTHFNYKPCIRLNVMAVKGVREARMGLNGAVCLWSHDAGCAWWVAVSEPHEAYRELGRLKAQQGLLAEAMMHYKHLLFFLP